MGISVTEISTPFGGVAWEYTDEKGTRSVPPLAVGQKINVFISSISVFNSEIIQICLKPILGGQASIHQIALFVVPLL